MRQTHIPRPQDKRFHRPRSWCRPKLGFCRRPHRALPPLLDRCRCPKCRHCYRCMPRRTRHSCFDPYPTNDRPRHTTLAPTRDKHTHRRRKSPLARTADRKLRSGLWWYLGPHTPTRNQSEKLGLSMQLNSQAPSEMGCWSIRSGAHSALCRHTHRYHLRYRQSARYTRSFPQSERTSGRQTRRPRT